MGGDIPGLGELEREVMHLVWAEGSVTAEVVRERLGKPLKESTVRTVLRRLEDKGYVTHTTEGRTYIFSAKDNRQKVAARAVNRIANWFCDGSIQDVLIGMVEAKMLDDKQLELLAEKIKAAKRRKS